MGQVKKNRPQHLAFEEKGFLYLNEVLSEDYCAELTAYMFDLYEKGKLDHDAQCPLSDSVYGDPLFDNVLKELCPGFSHNIGYELLPAYSNCRIYRGGEVLKPHRDRKSCEFSATITLGHDPVSEIWSIALQKNADDEPLRVKIGVGDAVMFKGNEVIHWRDQYTGAWQVQLFLFYVDKNGPHADHAFDKRPHLGYSDKIEDAEPVAQPQKSKEHDILLKIRELIDEALGEK